MKPIVYSRSAQKTLTTMPRNWARRVRDKIEAFAQDPASLANNVKALRGEVDLLRLRVGDWRVIMRDGVVLDILEVKPRGSAYKE
jgi:mRNA interferase RelE/StbE